METLALRVQARDGWPRSAKLANLPRRSNENSVHEETSLRSSMPRRSLTRYLNRRLRRSLTRRCSRRTVRRVGRGPRVCYLAQALTAFNRAVRARRRFARLAPEIFDSAVVSRREAEREDRRQLMAELEPIIQKVYGPATDSPPEELHHAQTDEWCRNGAEMVQFSPGKIQEIESLLAERELWMGVGQVALARHQTLQPHQRVSLSLVARLIDLASKLGRLAVGLELCPSQKSRFQDHSSGG